MKKITLSNETLANLVSKLGVFATSDNKVRFLIGIKDSGNGLYCQATIVNGGAMMKVAFKSNPPKTKVELEDGKPYMEFACKASDFNTMAQAILGNKADVTLTDGDGKVILSCLSGTKVPVGKVASETLEPLLPEDSEGSLAAFKGAGVAEALARGGFAASLDGATDVSACIEGGRLEVISLSKFACARYGCPVEVQLKAAAQAKPAGDADEGTLDEETLMGSKRFLIAQVGKIADEAEQQTFRGRVAAVANDPVAVVKLAKEYGYKPETAGTETSVSAAPIRFYLTGACLKLLTRIFSDCENAIYMVTPKTILVQGNNMRTTFALSTENPNLWKTMDRVEASERSIKVVSDRDALRSALQLMKLGDTLSSGSVKMPFKVSASAKGLLFQKEREDIQSLVAIIESAGNLEGFTRYYGSATFGDALSSMKAGNVLLAFSDDPRTPVAISNGTVENGGEGRVLLMPVDPTVASAAIEREKKKAEEPKKAEKPAGGEKAEEEAE